MVYQLHQMFPDAPIYTSYATKEWQTKLDGKVITGFLQRWPFPALRKFVPFLRIWWFSRLNLSEYDLVISSSGAEAKGIKTSKNTLHVNYCHAPTHYYWSRYDEYMRSPGFGPFNWLARIGLRLLVGPLKRWDYKAAQRPDYIIANSTHIQAEIKKYYDRDSVVIFPPVDVARFNMLSTTNGKQKMENDNNPRSGFVTAGRQTPYKRIDLAVTACTQLGLPLTVIGTGPDHDNLIHQAGTTITFLESVSDEDMAQHFQSASGFIFPGLDDFGITPVEAMAAGTTVIAFKGGGALDYVIPGKTGEFFEEQSAESLAAALQQFNAGDYASDDIKMAANSFSESKFRENLQSVLQNVLK